MGDLTDDEVAAAIAAEAGVLLLALRRGNLDASELAREGDRRSHELIISRLTELRGADPVLSEEGCSSPSGPGRLWIVDPLDGTREYSERRDDWAVHVALVVDGRADVGAVSLPALGVTYTSDRSMKLAGREGGTVRIAVSRTRPPPEALRVATLLDATLVEMGSAGRKAMAVLRGEADVYLHAGGQYEWDSAAPVAVARSAGLHASRLDGAPLVYGRRRPWLPDLLICRPELAPRVLEALRSA